MNKCTRLFFTLSILFSAIAVKSQEICDNGIDDDGDGRIDCYDGQDCSSSGACDDFFFGNVVECADDINVNSFAIRLQWASEDRSSNSHATPMVGDLDGNGIPEVVATNKQRRSVFVLNGATGATMHSFTGLSFQPENVPVLGDIDRDEFGEILVSQDQGDDLALFNHDLTFNGVTQPRWTAKSSRNDAIGIPGFADFDEDGDVEIYYRNEILDALTGNVLVAGTDIDWEKNFTHGSLAVDVLGDAVCPDCGGLELISGNEIWAINEAAGTRTLIRDMDNDIQSTPETDPFRSDATNASLAYYPKYYSNWDDQWSSVSAADYNLDGNMDLIITGALGTSSETFRGETTIFFWDVANGIVTTFHDPTNNFVRGPGRVNIGDVDGDGQLNANFVMDQKLYSLDENFNIHWIRPIKEGSSGFTGCSLFDFDGDGAVEVVYRSEESLLIVDGIGNGDNTTNIRNEIACVSRTQEEYPVVADVDGDGASEICLACYSNNATPFNPYSNTEFAQVRIYESDGEAWMPARGVWNQHAYYNVNINDDLTIPIEVQNHAEIFSPAGTCEYADGSIVPFDSRPLNTFLNQSPILNEDGCVEFASPDIEFVGILNATDAACPDATIEVTFQIRNIGDIAISGNLPVSYYAGDPRNATGVTYLDTEVTTLVNFEPETTIDIVQTITGVGGDFEIFVVINDNGTTTFPIQVPLPTAAIPECDTENNIQSTQVGFTRFDLITETLFDNRKCDDSVDDNGSARAFYFGIVPGENGTFWVENFEDRSDGATSDMDATAWTSDPGTENPSFYGVDTYQGSKMFSAVRTGGANDSGEVTWVSQAIDISGHTDVTATVDLFENGNQESSGQWRDYIIATYQLFDVSGAESASGEFTNGRQFGNFDYAQAVLTGVNNAGQGDSLLIVTVTIHNTSTSEFHYFDNLSVQGKPVPVPTIQTEADGFTFNWYNLGDTTNSIHTGSTIANLAEGQYIVEGFFGPTECFSALDTVTIGLIDVPQFQVHTYEIQPETNCSSPNGAAGAFATTEIIGGIPQDTLLIADGYQVSWRIALDGNNSVIATGNLLENRIAQEYIADIRETFTGCIASGSVDITSPNETIQGLAVSAVNINACGGTGTVSANVNGNISDFTFEWYDGPGIKPSVDFIGVDYTVSEVGEYTVVARDNTTGCTSDPETVLVEDNSSSPILNVLETQGNTSCGANPTGQARADVNGIVGAPDFSYTWFVGNNTLAANEIPGSALITATFGAGSWEMNGLADGTYTVIVEDNNTNCTDTATVSITDDTVIPSIDIASVSITPNTSCVASNGAIDASGAVSPSGNYVYNLYTGFTVSGTPTTNTTGIFTSLAPTTYTLVATNTDTECVSPAVQITIPDEPDDPILSTFVIEDAFCVDGSGQIRVTSVSNVSEPGAYTYELFEGFSFAVKSGPDITVSDGATGHTYLMLEDGNYRVRVTNDNLGCNSFVDVVVGDVSEDPEFSTSRLINDNTSCDASSPNGAISVSIDETGFDASNYTWEWYQGASADAAFLLSNPESGEGASVTIDGYSISANALTNIPAGDYTVFARDNETGCRTLDLTLTVDDNPVDIGATTTLLSPQTACGFGDGSIQARADGTDISAPCGINCVGSDGFTFEWYFGNDTSNPLDDADVGGTGALSFNADNTQVDGLTGNNNYTVLVRENSTQCFTTQTIFVPTDFDIPDLDATTTPNSVCDDALPTVNFDGTLTVTGTDNGGALDFSTGNYEITLYEGAGTTGTATTQTTNLFSQLADGPYTVEITNTVNGCTSNPEIFTVERTITDFTSDINLTDLPQISCDLGSPLGQITADVGGSTTNYTFQLFSGGTEITTNIIDNSPTNITFNLLASGSYRVLVTSTITGCAYDRTVSVDPGQVDPLITNPDTDPNQRCSDPNGSLSFDVVAGVGADSRVGASYLAELFEGGSIGPSETPIDNDTQSGPTASFQFDDLVDGNYTVRVTDLTTACDVVSDVFTVLYDGPVIGIDTAALITVSPTDCFDNGGSIDLSDVIELTDADGSESIEVRWFLGADTSASNYLPNLIPNFPYNTTTISTGGSVDSNLGANSIPADGLVLQFVPSVVYTAKVQLNNGCFQLYTIDLPDAQAPNLTVDVTQPASCNADGTVELEVATVTLGDLASNYEFTVHEGPFTVPARINDTPPYNPNVPEGTVIAYDPSAFGSTVTDDVNFNLSPGVYTLVVRRKTSNPFAAPFDGCPMGTFPITITEPAIPVIAAPAVTNNTFCGDGVDGGAEYNGSVTVNASDDGSPGDFIFTLFTVSGTTYTPVNDGDSDVAGDIDFEVVFDLSDANSNGSADEIMVSGLGEHAGGSAYAIIAESSVSASCQDTVLFDVLNDPLIVTASGTVTDIENCTPFTGGFTVTSVNPDLLSDYSFIWRDEFGADVVDDADKLDYTSAGDYFVMVTNTLNGCETRIDFTIEDNTEVPIIEIMQDATDTHCEPTTGTGQLTAAVIITPYVVSDYTFTWYEGDAIDPLKELSDPSTDDPSVIATSYSISADGDVLSGLPDGMYTVSVVDNAGTDIGCESFLITSVPELIDIPILSLSGIEVAPDSLCGAPTSGQFIIDDSDITPGVLADYTFTVERGSLGSGIFAVPDFSTPGEILYDNLEAGSYFISAIKDASAIAAENTGCEIAPIRIEIEDVSTLPLVTLERLIPDQNCGAAATNEGEIEVLVDGLYTHTTPRFNFLWEVAGGGPLPVAVTDNEATLSGVPAGMYQVTVTNTNTVCSVTREFEVPNEVIIPIISRADSDDNTNCTPDNGAFNLLQVIYDGDIYEEGGLGVEIDGEFELRVLRSSDNAEQGRVSNVPYTIGNLAPDPDGYYAQVIHLATGCTSEPYNFTIEDDPNLPEVILTLDQADSTCQVGFSPNGQVTALANGENDTNADYNFQWYFGAAAEIGTTADTLDGSPLPNGSVPVGFDESTVSGLAAGIYSVQVSQISNGCVVTEEITIPNVPVEVEIISLNTTNATTCTGNGIIDIAQVNRSGQADDPLNYTFQFFTENPLVGSPVPVFTVPTDGPVFNEAQGDITYFIVGTHNSLGCVTSPFQTIILENIERPILELADFAKQSNCDPENPNGTITVLADGQPDNADYDFQWYLGDTVLDSLTADDYTGGSNLMGASTNVVSGLAAGTYTVEVINNNNGCTTAETYRIDDLTPDDLDITVTVTDDFNCETPMGSVSAEVNGGSQELRDLVGIRSYTYYWFVGTIAEWGANPDTTQASFRGQTIMELPQGNYVVYAVDRADGFCNSITKQANINYIPDVPEFELTTIDVTNCFDPGNGFAAVVVADLSTVEITWRNEMSDSIGTGEFIDSLNAGGYQVEVRNTASGCVAPQFFEILNNAIIPSNPSVIVNNGRNNCRVPNGSAVANVDGVTNNFLFEWFTDPNQDEPYTTGFQVNNLDSGTYFVRATNIITGCPSGFTEAVIEFSEIEPIFTVQVDNSICLRTEDGSTNQFTGSAIIAFEEFNLPLEYEWTFLGDATFQTEEVVSRDSRLLDASPGNYRVRFIAQNGCEYISEFSIDVTLNIYNGVSANDDGKNDFFLIDCLEYFPLNNVKIYNRAGQRIYEVDGYNNRDIRFEGNSNVGGGGLNLPSGTYFYLVDLGTGEDPIQGYLELVR